jgi:hypothetical protein
LDVIERPNLWNTGIDKRKEVQTKGIENIFNKILAENCSNFEKEIVIHVEDIFRIPNRQYHKGISPHHIITIIINKHLFLIFLEHRESKIKALIYLVTSLFSQIASLDVFIWGWVEGGMSAQLEEEKERPCITLEPLVFRHELQSQEWSHCISHGGDHESVFVT